MARYEGLSVTLSVGPFLCSYGIAYRSRPQLVGSRLFVEKSDKLWAPQKALCGGIPCSFLEPFARSWSHLWEFIAKNGQGL